MPGTVQVSILEFTGLPSSKSSSSMSIKVSLGKNTYEAEGEKADFLFPLATLRDNLVVKVHDTDGNEIAHTGVKSRLIAEKGSWDDLFPLKGGGHIHMRLKFSLSEEERNKIRNMRESALRKKQEELQNKNNRDLQAIVVSSGGRNEMPSTETISDKVQSFDLPLETSSRVVSSKSSSTPSNSSASEQVKEDDQPYNSEEQNPLEKTPSKLQEDDQPYNSKEQSPLEKTPSKAKKEDQLHNLKEQSQWKKTPSEVKDDDQRGNLKKQNPLEKTSRKVRETIAAFESSRLTQGLMTTAKEQSGKEISDPHPKEETSQNIYPTSTQDEREAIANKTEFNSKEISDEKEPKGKYPLHYIVESEEREPSKEFQRPSNLEQNKISGRDHDFSGRRRRCSCHNFHGWIFLEEAICSCIVSDNRVVLDLLGDYSVNPKTYPGKLVDDEVTSSKEDKLSGINKKPGSSHSSGDGASKGPKGQVMKIVIMVGFGLLVLFTRKRKSR